MDGPPRKRVKVSKAAPLNAYFQFLLSQLYQDAQAKGSLCIPMQPQQSLFPIQARSLPTPTAWPSPTSRSTRPPSPPSATSRWPTRCPGNGVAWALQIIKGIGESIQKIFREKLENFRAANGGADPTLAQVTSNRPSPISPHSFPSQVEQMKNGEPVTLASGPDTGDYFCDAPLPPPPLPTPSTSTSQVVRQASFCPTLPPTVPLATRGTAQHGAAVQHGVLRSRQQWGESGQRGTTSAHLPSERRVRGY